MKLVDTGRTVFRVGICFACGILVSLAVQTVSVLVKIYTPVMATVSILYLLVAALFGLLLISIVVGGELGEKAEEAEEFSLEFRLTVFLPLLVGLITGCILMIVYFGDTLTALLS